MVLPSLAARVTPIVCAAISGTVAYAGYKIEDVLADALFKTTDAYAPDRKLPMTENGIPIPDTDAPHTQLRTRKESKGSYPQAREFDKNGRPIRGIDFTDHGYPKNRRSYKTKELQKSF